MVMFETPEGDGSGGSSAETCTCFFETIADMAAYSAPATETMRFNEEVQRNYLFVPGDTTTDDGWSSVSSTAGIAGRWLLQADSVSLGLSGGDDGAYISSAAAALAGKAAIYLRGVAFQCSTGIKLPSNTVMHWEPTTEIISTLDGGDGPVIGTDDYVVNGAATTLEQDTEQGSKVIIVSDNAGGRIAAGSKLALVAGAERLQVYRVATAVIIGAGPTYTVTLDRPVYQVYRALDGVGNAYTQVQPLTSFPHDIYVYGNGGRMSGTGGEYFLISGGRDCLFQGVKIDLNDGSVDGPLAAYFHGGLRVRLEMLEVDGRNTLGAGIDLMCCEDSLHYRNLITNCGGGGVTMDDCVHCDVVECKLRGGNGSGFQVSSNDLGEDEKSIQGCIDCRLISCSAWGASVGFSITHKSDGIQVIGCDAWDCSDTGLRLLTDTYGWPTNTIINGFRAIGNGGVGSGAGIYVEAGVKGTKASNLYVSGSDYAFWLLDDFDAQNVKVERGDGANNASRIYTTGAVKVNFTNLEITSLDTAIQATAAARVNVRGMRASVGVNGLAIYASFSAFISVEDALITGGAGSSGLVCTDAGSLLIGDHVDASGCTTPINDGGATGFVSRGTVTQTLGVATYPWPLAKASDVPPVVNRISTGQGAVGAGGVLVNIVAGTGFTITSIDLNGNTVATDESTFDVRANAP